MAFLDPTVPIATCDVTDCSECPVAESIHCHFRPAELAHFLLICMPSFFVGGAALLAVGLIPLLVWVAIFIGFFGFVEIRVMCSHCPHYAEEGSTLKCWANHGSPKLWKYRPGPMSTAENIVFFAGVVAVWVYPLPFFVVGRQWFLLGLYILLSAGFFTTLKMFLCSQCMNFACPLNGVPEPIRNRFFDRNPLVADAWKPSAQTLSSKKKR